MNGVHCVHVAPETTCTVQYCVNTHALIANMHIMLELCAAVCIMHELCTTVRIMCKTENTYMKNAVFGSL